MVGGAVVVKKVFAVYLTSCNRFVLAANLGLAWLVDGVGGAGMAAVLGIILRVALPMLVVAGLLGMIPVCVFFKPAAGWLVACLLDFKALCCWFGVGGFLLVSGCRWWVDPVRDSATVISCQFYHKTGV